MTNTNRRQMSNEDGQNMNTKIEIRFKKLNQTTKFQNRNKNLKDSRKLFLKSTIHGCKTIK
jgi:hypothetical protein